MRCLMTPWTLKKPVIASVQGHALGGGCELAMFCDLTIAAEDALFGEPEVLFSQVGPAVLMPFIVGHKRARELIYFGDKIDAKRAHEIGMVNRIVPPAELAAATMKYARRLALIAPEALAAAKLAVNRGLDAAGFRNALNDGLDVLAPLYAAETEVGKQFDAIRAKDGLKAALAWRKRAVRGMTATPPPRRRCRAALRAASRACFTGDSTGSRLNSFCALPPRMFFLACMSMNGRS